MTAFKQIAAVAASALVLSSLPQISAAPPVLIHKLPLLPESQAATLGPVHTNGDIAFFAVVPAAPESAKVWRSDGTKEGTFVLVDKLLMADPGSVSNHCCPK